MHPRILAEAAEHLRVHAGDAGGGLEQALAVGILPDGGEDLTDGPLDTGMVDGVWLAHGHTTLPSLRAADVPPQEAAIA
jgi:hypothetical protein